MRQHVQAPDGRNELDFENDSNRIIADSAVLVVSSKRANAVKMWELATCEK
jgi:hypothetical protein